MSEAGRVPAVRLEEHSCIEGGRPRAWSRRPLAATLREEARSATVGDVLVQKAPQVERVRMSDDGRRLVDERTSPGLAPAAQVAVLGRCFGEGRVESP
jgi:hypothetical protein